MGLVLVYFIALHAFVYYLFVCYVSDRKLNKDVYFCQCRPRELAAKTASEVTRTVSGKGRA